MTDKATNLLNRLEWDFEDVNKAEWGKGEWLNEPDKVQCIKEGYHCIILRSHHGSLCGYVGVDKKHPCYGLTGNGISALVADILQAEFLDELVKTKGDPFKMKLTDHPEPDTDAGRAMLSISVHGGITYAKANVNSSKEVWLDLRSSFEKVRKQALIYPIGDSARWLKRWIKAEYSYSEFLRIVEQTCICLVLGDRAERSEDLWWLGFDCAHVGDLAPAMEALTWSLPSEATARDVYRNLEYVEDQCLQLAIQLRAIEEARHDKN